jgi:hypothetical protein
MWHARIGRHKYSDAFTSCGTGVNDQRNSKTAGSGDAERLDGRWRAIDIVGQNRPMPEILFEIEQQKVSMHYESRITTRTLRHKQLAIDTRAILGDPDRVWANR